LLVVVYHFWPGRLQGGYIGVDVFFVISGFLITGQLVRELDRTNRIRLPEFYARRVRRLLPAALTVIVFSILATLFILPLSSLAENLREILASTFYVENWALALNSVDYLAAANEASTVQHYWSLSLEEQFYLFWPLLMLGAAALGVRFWSGKRWRALLAVAALVTLLSLVYSIVATQTSPAQAYFNTFTRVWEFGIGALLALLPALRPRRAWQSNIAGYVGIAMILGAGYFYDKSTPFPGWTALVPVLGTALVISASHHQRWWDATRVLSIRPMRFIGDISYSLYLWHWPLIVIAPFIPGWGLSFVNRVILFLLCFVVAWLTKKYIEDSARTWKFLGTRKPRVTFGYMVAGMAVATALVFTTSAIQQPKYDAAATELAQTVANQPACFGAAAGPTNGLTAIEPCANPDLVDAIIPSPGFGNADRPQHPECLTTLNDSTLNTCEFGAVNDPNAPRVALIGDSHAYALSDPFIQFAEDNGWHLTTYLKGGCSWNAEPLAGGDAFAASCSTWRDNLSVALADQKPFDAVFTTALAAKTLSTSNTSEAAGFAAAWQPVLQAGTPIVTMVDNPSWEEDPNKCLRTSGAAAGCTESAKSGLAQNDAQAVAASELAAAGQNITLLTRTFAFTLVPFIGQAVNGVLSAR
jgi:peptidoglycan/LPS O-acetylase OafA/YrhL